MYNIRFCLSIQLSRDTWIVSTLWLLWIILLWTWTYKNLFQCLLSILLSIYPRNGNAGSRSNSILYSHQKGTKVLISPHFCKRYYLDIFCSSHPNVHKMSTHYGFDLHFPSDWSIFSCVWRNVYSNPLAIFELDCFLFLICSLTSESWKCFSYWRSKLSRKKNSNIPVK